MDGLNLEQLGTAGLFIGFLFYILNLAWKKIDKHETTIEGLHERNTQTLTETLKSQQESHSILARAIDYFQQGRRDG